MSHAHVCVRSECECAHRSRWMCVCVCVCVHAARMRAGMGRRRAHVCRACASILTTTLCRGVRVYARQLACCDVMFICWARARARARAFYAHGIHHARGSLRDEGERLRAIEPASSSIMKCVWNLSVRVLNREDVCVCVCVSTNFCQLNRVREQNSHYSFNVRPCCTLPQRENIAPMQADQRPPVVLMCEF